MSSKTGQLGLGALVAAAALLGSNAWAALSIDVLSSRPDLVSNASALVAIKGGNGNPQVTWDNRDITKLFTPDPNTAGQWVGLVVGLINGKNVPIQARAGGEVATLQLVNHAVNKELFS